VERLRFDAILLNNARKKGVEVRERHKVTAALEEGDRVQGVKVLDAEGQEYAVRSKFVVDASGSSSILAASAGERVYSRFFQNIAVFAYFNNGKRLPDPSSGNIFCCAFDKGWFWYIPLSPTLTSVGAVIGKEHVGLIGEGREAAYLQLIKECAPISDLLTNATRVTEGTYGQVRVRKDFSYCNTKFWKPGLVLVGDAACFIDPVFSSGVHLATYSGLLAARSINTCLSGTLAEPDAFREFERRYLREYRIFYDFLTAFYDVDQDLETYYWAARKALNSAEIGNEAFIQLVGGLGDTAEPAYRSSFDFVSSRDATKAGVFSAARGASNDMFVESHRRSAEGQKFLSELYREGAELQALATNPNFALRPVFKDGLVPSADGSHWVSPT
jgi:halogenation protein CepH